MWYLKTRKGKLLFVVKYFEHCPKNCPYRRSDGTCEYESSIKECYYDDVYKIDSEIIDLLKDIKRYYGEKDEEFFLSALYQEDESVAELAMLLSESIPIGTVNDIVRFIKEASNLIVLKAGKSLK